MQQLQILDSIEFYIDNKEMIWLNLEHISLGLEILKVDRKNNKEYKRINKQLLQKWLFYFGIINSEKDNLPKFIPEPIFYLLSMKAENAVAKAFQYKVAYEILPQIRKTGTYTTTKVLPTNYIEALKQLIISEEEIQQKELEKKQIEAEKDKLQIELEYSKDWYSIKRVSQINGVSWKTFDWKKLKSISTNMSYGIKKIFDANYGEVNTYHCDVWAKAYPEYETR